MNLAEVPAVLPAITPDLRAAERNHNVSDTSPEAAAIQASIIRNMTGEQRLMLALDMSLMARELALTRLRLQHPDWSEWELKRELLRYAFGSEPLPPPLR